MAPFLNDQAPVVDAEIKSKDRPRLYQNLDQTELQKVAGSSLINYGTKFETDIITGSSGLYVYTANGHKVLDWTSGQMSCLIGHGHPEIVETIKYHAEHLDHLFSGMLSPLYSALRSDSTLPFLPVSTEPCSSALAGRVMKLLLRWPKCTQVNSRSSELEQAGMA